MCGFVNLFYFIMEPKKFESILNKNMGEFFSSLDEKTVTQYLEAIKEKTKIFETFTWQKTISKTKTHCQAVFAT